ncbi:MAG: PAS domain-containing protein [Actinomycetota bacterium]|nr:PAS domain-containing protein [Actinomycetota bacterium]
MEVGYLSEQKVAGRLGAALARAEDLEAMYRSLVESLPAITYTEAVDDHRVLSVSPQVKIMLGYTQEEWFSNPLLCEELLHPEDRDRVVEACNIANRNREPYRAEYRMIAKDGRIVWVRDEATLVYGSKGQPLCWQGVMLDITAERQAQEALNP